MATSWIANDEKATRDVSISGMVDWSAVFWVHGIMDFKWTLKADWWIWRIKLNIHEPVHIYIRDKACWLWKTFISYRHSSSVGLPVEALRIYYTQGIRQIWQLEETTSIWSGPYIVKSNWPLYWIIARQKRTEGVTSSASAWPQPWCAEQMPIDSSRSITSNKLRI